MVHYRQHSPGACDGTYTRLYSTIVQFPEKEYWKLAAENVNDSRTERGFLDYEQCTIAELRQFCKQRCLTLELQPGQRATFAKFKKALQHADEVVTFNGLLDLPTELRLRIYEMYKDSLHFDHFCVAPPITAVSKSVRHEASSVFFKQRLFLIHRERTWPPLADMSLQRVTRLFFDNASLCFVQYLRRLEIMSPIGCGTGYAEFEINLSANERERRACFVSMGTFCWSPWSLHRAKVELMVESVVAQLRDLTDIVVARRPVAFERADADAILRIFASTTSIE